MKLTLGKIADLLHAEGDFKGEAEALGYSIDSRTIAAGELYFAVRGERLDGHDFVEAALANGAVAAVVSMRWLRPADVDPARLLLVPDEILRASDEGYDCVLHALQQLAAAVRRMWGKRVIGVTGSAGKTTTKECIAAVLGTAFKVLKTEGNLNNHFGVPLQLLRLEPEHEVAVLEMGMNHAGEIRALARIAAPDWAVVSNVAPVHLEFFPDGLEGIARAKYELVESLPPDGRAILNGDDDRVAAYARGLGDRAVLYGTRPGLPVRATAIQEQGLRGTDCMVRLRGEPELPLRLQLPGRHNVLNALAALAVGQLAGVRPDDALTALGAMQPTEKRGNTIHFHEAMLVNDTYNANPLALDAMVRALRETPAGRRIVVAGEMLELGAESRSLHHSCGEAMQGIDLVLGVRGEAQALVEGATAAGLEARYLETPEQAGAWLLANLRAGDVVLLKGSRGVRLECALEALTHDPAAPMPEHIG